MRRSLILASVTATAVAATAVGGATLSAAASATANTLSASLVRTVRAVPKDYSLIERSTAKGHRALYEPTVIAGPTIPAGASCSGANYTAFVYNKTTVSQQITLHGASFGPAIPSGGVLRLCATAVGSKTFSLQSNTAATLTLTAH